jgi:tetratricopeptide (TPR) repeat protein
VLRSEADQLDAVNEAFGGLDDELRLRRSWGLLKDADFESYLGKITAGLTDPAVQARVELAKAGLPFIEKDGGKQYPAALTRFRAVVSANPSLTLTGTEASRYGQLLIAAKDFTTAAQVYQNLLEAGPKDPATVAEADYGLGATALAQGDLPGAQKYFLAMKALPGGAAWSPHIAEADYGLALAAEKSGQRAQLDSALQTYAALMQSASASVDLQARAMLGYGRVLAAEGFTTAPKPGTSDSAVFYFRQVDTLFGPATPELSAEGLYDAAELYEKAGDAKDAQAMKQMLQKNYGTSAPDWASKASSP